MLTNLFQRYYLWTFLILSGLAGLAVGNLGATLFGLLNKSDSTKIEFPRTEVRQTATKQSLRNYQDIVQRNIFNSAQSDRSAELAKPASRRQTGSSKWSLVGTVSGGVTPLATLQDSSGSATYALDEELPDGAILSAVERNRVKLRYSGGRTIILEIEEPQQQSISPQQRPESIRRSNKLINSLGNNRWQIPALVAENARENIGELLKQAHAVPYLEGGRTTGFQLEMLQRGSLLDNIGLKKGDILRAINGQELNSPEKALQIFGQLRQATQINIDLERRGKAMTFAYEIR